MKLVLIPPGELMMGSPNSDDGAGAAEKPQHRVRITRPFYLATYAVTQAEYQEIMGTNPSEFTEKQAEASTFAFPLSETEVKARLEDRKKAVGKDTSHHPVETVNWGQAREFCRTLSAMPAERSAGRVYRLPTEAEWEHACRAGTTTRWYCGDDEAGLVEAAWFSKNAGGMTHPVGEKKPNAWGLYDMSGNVCQWCSDKIIDYKQSPLNDPVGPPDCFDNVVRGGYWADNASSCRSASRLRHGSIGRFHNPGFRVVVEVVAETAGGKGKADGSSTGATPIPNPPSPIPPLAIAPFDEKRAKEHQAAWAKYLGVPTEMTNAVGMKLVLIPPGEFLMGEGQESHKVVISKPFYLGKYAVTQEQWQAVTGLNPSEFKGPKNPVEKVSWDDCQVFLKRLGEKCRVAEGSFRLPTSAEWEYAYRAGSKTNYFFGDDESQLADYAWYAKNSGGTTHPVGEKKPNAWGLRDMCGNVWQWASDWYDLNYIRHGFKDAPMDDPPGPHYGDTRTWCGGSWNCRSTVNFQAAWRFRGKPEEPRDCVGLRVCMVLPEKPKPPTPAASGTVAAPQSQISNLKSDIPTAVPGKLSPGAPPPAIAPFDSEQAKQHQQAWAKHLNVPVETTNSIGMKLVLIPPGEFTMGDENCGKWEKPLHKVVISKPFYLGKYEVTQEEWAAVLGINPSRFKGPRNPVEQVSWEDCQNFLKKLDQKCGAAEGSYSLPSEAQWEYACRAGTTGKWFFGESEAELGDYAWYNDNSEGKPHPVGEKKANGWGLHDVYGNVWEWCADWFDNDYYKESPLSDPGGPSSGAAHVIRGGGWDYPDPARGCRSAHRGKHELRFLHYAIGLRVFRVLAEKPGTPIVAPIVAPQEKPASTHAHESPNPNPQTDTVPGTDGAARRKSPTTTSAPELPNQRPMDGEFMIISAWSGLAMQAPADQSDDGLAIVQGNRNGGKNQRWRFHEVDGTGGCYKIVNVATGKALDSKDPSLANGSALIQNASSNAPSQQWQIGKDKGADFGLCELMSRSTGQVIELPEGSKEQQKVLELQTDHNRLYQYWKLEKVRGELATIAPLPSNQRNLEGEFTIISVCSGLAMQAPAGMNGDGLAIVQWDRNGQQNQRWRFEDVDGTGRWHKIVNVGTGKALNVKDPSQHSASHALIQNTSSDSQSQHWQVDMAAENGFCKLVSRSMSMQINLPMSHKNNGAELIIWPSTPGINIYWKLEKVVGPSATAAPAPPGADQHSQSQISDLKSEIPTAIPGSLPPGVRRRPTPTNGYRGRRRRSSRKSPRRLKRPTRRRRRYAGPTEQTG